MRYLLHTALTVATQVAVGLASGDWASGGILMSGFYISREVTQAEYRWIEAYGSGLRANMPWWGRFDARVWKPTDLLDWILPCVAAGAVAVVSKIM